MYGFHVEARDQRVHIGEILRVAVVGRMAQPLTLAATDDIGANDPVAILHRCGKHIKVTAVACQTMNADEDI